MSTTTGKTSHTATMPMSLSLKSLIHLNSSPSHMNTGRFMLSSLRISLPTWRTHYRGGSCLGTTATLKTLLLLTILTVSQMYVFFTTILPSGRLMDLSIFAFLCFPRAFSVRWGRITYLLPREIIRRGNRLLVRSIEGGGGLQLMR